MKVRKKLKTAELVVRARNMGDYGGGVCSPESRHLGGIWPAKQRGDDIQVSILYSSLLWRLLREYC